MIDLWTIGDLFIYLLLKKKGLFIRYEESIGGSWLQWFRFPIGHRLIALLHWLTDLMIIRWLIYERLAVYLFIYFSKNDYSLAMKSQLDARLEEAEGIDWD